MSDEGLSPQQIALARGQKVRAGFGGAAPEIKPPDRKNVHYRVTNQSPIDVMKAKNQITEPMRQAGDHYRRAYERSQVSPIRGRDFNYIDPRFGPREPTERQRDALKERSRLAEQMSPMQFYLLDRVAGAGWSLALAGKADAMRLVHPMGKIVTRSAALTSSLQEALQIAAEYYGLCQSPDIKRKILNWALDG